MYDQNLPEHYVSDDGQRVSAPAYEAITNCQVILVSGETGIAGPTLMEVGDHFITEATPCHAWRPLNRAAGDRIEKWLQALPLDGKAIAQEDINEAAYTLRPREGDPEFPMEAWWPQVLRLAATLADKRKGRTPTVAPGFRPVTPNAPPMPFAQVGSAMPTEAGRPPPGAQMPMPANAGRQARVARNAKPAMPNANVTGSPQQTAG